MHPTGQEITRLLVASPEDWTQGSFPIVSIGIGLSGQRVFWGDCQPVPDILEQMATLQRLVDLSERALLDHPATNFRELCGLFQVNFPRFGLVPVADAVRGAIQQALLFAVSTTHQVSPAQIMADEYELAPIDGQINIPVFLEVTDFSATTSLIDKLLALRPAGLGYRLTSQRVAEAIGENAEYLQRFVRQLGQRSDRSSGTTESWPKIYLGLNGAFGALAGDPVQHIGKVLEFCIGLQDAAGERQIIFEDPFLLDNPMVQTSNMRRLKGLIFRAPSAQNRIEQSLILQRASNISENDFSLYVDTQAAHGLTFELSVQGDIDKTMRQLALIHTSGMRKFISLAPPNALSTSSRLALVAADIAIASQASGILINFDDANPHHFRSVMRYMAEAKAWFH